MANKRNETSTENVSVDPEVLQPLTQEQLNAYLINTLQEMAKSVSESNKALADLYEKKAEGLKREPLTDFVGKPDDYSGPAWQEKEVVRLYMDNNKYKDEHFVCVNGRPYLLKRGVDLVVPRAVAEALKEQQAQDNNTAAMIRKLVEDGAAREREIGK